MHEQHETADLIEDLQELADEVERHGIGQVTSEQRNDLRDLHNEIRQHVAGLDRFCYYTTNDNNWFAPD